MRMLLAFLAGVLSVGLYFSAGGPTPDPEAPMCDHEDCVRLRSPSATREAQGPGELPGFRYRADTPPSAEVGLLRHPVTSKPR